MEAFIDTGIFCAVANAKDSKNQEIKELLESLELKGFTLCTSDYVLDETYTLIRMRVNHSASVRFMEGFKNSKISVKRVNEETEEYAKRIFIKYGDKTFSFTDCTSFAIIELHKIEGVLSLDKDFERFKIKHRVEFFI